MNEPSFSSKQFEKVYRNIGNPASLSTPSKLYTEVKKKNKKVKLSDAKKFLQGKDSYTLHQERKKKFSHRFFLFAAPGRYVLADVAYMHRFEKCSPYKYLLVLMDGFSRFLTTYPLKTLKSNEIVPIMEKFFDENIYKYEKFLSDSGQEFVNSRMKKLYAKHKISWRSTKNERVKIAQIERLIKFLKQKIIRYTTEFNSKCYLKDLDKIVQSYNMSTHRTLSMTPIDAHLMRDPIKIQNFLLDVYKRKLKEIKPVRHPYPVGTHVRLSTHRKIFDKIDYYQYTREIFTISQVIDEFTPITYKITDLDGDDIEGVVYHSELIKVTQKNLYDIDIIKKRKFKGVLHYLVNWSNYPTSPTQWVKASEIKKK